MSTLAPGTRISVAEWEVEHHRAMETWHGRAYYRGLAEGGAVGLAMGLLTGACLTALAWSHLGG